MTETLVIVFARNVRAGRVKTRLATMIGDSKALKIYQLLKEHTIRQCETLQHDKAVYYTDFIPASDEFTRAGFKQNLQQGNDLGERMVNAFRSAFIRGYNQVILVGSDCYELESHHLTQAFFELSRHQAVIGPAKDGGYYLIGFTEKYDAKIFDQIAWSTSDVLPSTQQKMKDAGIDYALLPELGDIDTFDDLLRYPGLVGLL